jgi:uncharacterized membrane protein YgcG
MRLLRLLAALVALLLLALPALAREEIRAFASDVTLRTDGSVEVIETIDVNAEGVDIRRGIYRDIPTVMAAPDGGKIRAGLDVLSVTREGEPETYRVERMGNFQRIWIGDPDRLLSRGEHRYVVTYTMGRMGRFFDDHDELYWNATGNYWIFPIVRSVARVTLPQGAVIEDLVAYTGEVGSTEQAVSITRTADNQATFRTQRALAAGEGMSFAVAFQKDVLVPPSGFAAFLIWLSDARDIFLPILGVALVLAYNFSAWHAVGRDPAKGTIIPLFYPPQGFSPALTHYVHKWGFEKSGWTAFTAALFSLGTKGLVTIDNPGEALSVAATGKQPDDPLPVGERILFDYVTAEGRVDVNKATGTELNRKRGEFVAAIEGENRQTWFRKNTGFAVLGFLLAILILFAMVAFDVLDPVLLIVGVVIGILLALFGTALGSFWRGNAFQKVFTAIWVSVLGFNFLGGGLELFTSVQINTAAIAATSIVLITVGFAVLMRAPTIQGRKVMDEIEGFKLYLETAEKERLNIIDEPPLTVERFEAILPYAIALGVEKPWSEHFEAELSRNANDDQQAHSYRPRWYSGSGSFSSARLPAAISAAAAGMSAAMIAAQPVQASSSGFSSGGGGGGGGFSGGGGGGGGGGGW